VAARRRLGRAGASSVADTDVAADAMAGSGALAARLAFVPWVRRAFGRAAAGDATDAIGVGSGEAVDDGSSAVPDAMSALVIGVGSATAAESREPCAGSSSRRDRDQPKGIDSFRVVRDMRAPVGKCSHRSPIG
jgi:hypothetical protein